MAGIGPVVIEIDGEDDSDSDSSLEMGAEPGSPRVWTEDLIRFLENERWGSGSRPGGEPAGVVIDIGGSSDDDEPGGAMETDDEVELVAATALGGGGGIGRKPEEKLVGEELDWGLGCLTLEEVKELIESACSRLKSSLDSMKLVATDTDGRGPVVDAGHTGIPTACFVPDSSHLIKIEQDKQWLLRLLLQIKKQCPSLFTSEQMGEMDIMLQTVLSAGVYKEKEANGRRGCVVNRIATLEGETPSSNCLELEATGSVGRYSGEGGMATLEQPVISTEREAPFTEQATSMSREIQDSMLSPNATDNMNTVCSYQQRYGQASLPSANQLLSLTPKVQCSGDDDTIGECSTSSSTEGDVRNKGSGSACQDVGSSRSLHDMSKPKAASSRSTRLDREVLGMSRNSKFRFLNTEVDEIPRNGIAVGLSTSLKRKAADNIKLNDHILNIQRNRCSTDTSSMASQPNSRIQVNENVKINTARPANEEMCFGKKPDANTNYNSRTLGIKQIRAKSTTPGVTLHCLLEEVSASSPMLVHLIEMGQQQIIAEEAQQRTTDLRKNQVETAQLPEQTASMNGEDLGSEQIRSSEPLTLDTQNNKEFLTTLENGEHAQTASSPAHCMSKSQLTSTPAAVPPSICKPISNMAEKVDTVPAARELNDQQNMPILFCRGVGDTSPSSNPWGNVGHLLDGFDDQQKAAIQIERARRIEEQNKMFAAGKLCLVLDLDHTLLNSAKFEEVDPVHEKILRKREEEGREKSQRYLFHLPHMGMWTKLRPGIWNFLEKASKLFELHIYTMGNKLYATEMAKVLDPTGALFAGRIIARGNGSDCPDCDERLPKSKDLDGVLGMESAVVIIDDTARVWPHHKPNLITVEKYTYFPCSRRQFGLPGPSLLEIDHDERATDGTLASSLEVIERIHRDFFSHHFLCEADVRKILVSEQRKVLAGCCIVFSRVFPTHEANPQLHPLWRTAEQFGAICTNQIDEEITHVVATLLGTDKVNWALSTNRYVVRPSWVEASALLYRRGDERQFAIKSKPKKLPPSTLKSGRKIMTSFSKRSSNE